MADTLLSSVSSALNLSTRQDIAKLLGEPEPAVSKGLELATSAVFAGLNRQANQSETMRQVIDMASKAPADLGAALTSGQLASPNSPLLLGGKKFLASVLGTTQDSTLAAVARDSGLRATSTGAILALAAQSVLSFIGTRVREEGMTATALAGFLQSRVPPVSGVATTPGVATASSDPLVTTRRVEIDPVVAQTVQKERSIWLWLLPLLLILLGLLLWFVFRSKPAPVAEAPAPVEAPAPAAPAAPVAPQLPDLGSLVPRQLPDGTTLNIPERGVEGRLLAFIQDPAQKPNKTSWFDFDRLLFATGSATLQPQSLEQLHNIAAILKAYPHTQLTIGGYTDDTGDAAGNLQLSQDRANNVTAELVKLGVARDRLVAKGYGQEHPVADNATEAGRAQNRRISMLVTEK